MRLRRLLSRKFTQVVDSSWGHVKLSGHNWIGPQADRDCAESLRLSLEFLHLDSQRAAVDNGPLRGERVRRSRGCGVVFFFQNQRGPHPPLRGPPSPASGRGLLSTDISPPDQNVQTPGAWL